MTEQHQYDPIHDSPTADPNAPWHYLDHPQEGFVRVWHGTGDMDFLDMTEEDVEASYVDANIVNVTVQPTTLLEIVHEPLNIYYANGASYQTTLMQIGETPYLGTKFIYLAAGLVGIGLDDLTPLFNPYTTPGLAFIKMRFLEEMQQRAADLLEAAELVNAFSKIIAEYGQLDNPAQALIRELMKPSDQQ